MPIISVVMSCFNCAETLCDAIDSLLNQTFRDNEYIFIDDCSTDNTLNILEGYALKDNRIKIIKNAQNKGLAFSLNKGIQSSLGSFIARMDADDISLPLRFEKQMNFLKQNPNVDVLGTGAILINGQRKKLGTLLIEEKHADIIKRRYKNSLFIHPSIIAKKSFFERNNYYDTTLLRAQDADLWMRGIENSNYHNLQEELIQYTVKEGTSFKILRYTTQVKYINMKRRKELLSHGHHIIKSFANFILIKFFGRKRGPHRGKYEST